MSRQRGKTPAAWLAAALVTTRQKVVKTMQVSAGGADGRAALPRDARRQR